MRKIGTTPGHEFVTRRVNEDPVLQKRELRWVKIHNTCPRCRGKLDVIEDDLPDGIRNQVIRAGASCVIACPPCNVFYFAAKRS